MFTFVLLEMEHFHVCRKSYLLSTAYLESDYIVGRNL